MGTGITELAIIMVVAAVLGIIARLLKQPTIIAYIATGAVIVGFGFLSFENQEVLHIFSEIGIILLLFLVGMEINYESLRLVGKTSLFVGLGQIIFTAFFGFLISTFLGFETITALYIAIGLTFSSTIIIVQLLSDKKALNGLYGKISVGFLLVQDFVAIIILLVLGGIEAGGSVSLGKILLTTLEGIALFVAMVILGRKLFPFIFNKIAQSRELLFLSSLAWLFVLTAVISKIGFSIEIGGFLAGLALANSSQHFEIASRVKPLRDLFMLVFFAILGSSVAFSSLSGLGFPIIILSLFVLIGNPLIVLIIMGLMGYEKRVSFLSGVTVAQISEFSLIVAALGLRIGHINQEVVALITAVGVVTITVSAYMIVYADRIFKVLSPYLDIFERKNKKDIKISKDEMSKPIVLIGFKRTGQSIASGIDKDELLVIDFDPEVITELDRHGYTTFFGDISDFDIADSIDLKAAKVIISTSPVLSDNQSFLNSVKKRIKKVDEDSRPKLIVRAENKIEAKILYKEGADYVLVPEFVSGHYLNEIIKDSKDLSILKDIRKRDLLSIKDSNLLQ
ncbi:MAG: cation:proton antiporter [Candidatus Paceibacterota bacterium]